MQRLAKKLLGITPEIEERAREMVRATDARAAELPYVLNRRTLVLLPKAKFFEWKRRWDEGYKVARPVPDPERDRWAYARTYLISITASDKEVQRIVAANRKYFLDSWVNGHAPKGRWPWKPSEDEFDQWYEVQVIDSAPRDLAADLLQKEPDMEVAVGPEL